MLGISHIGYALGKENVDNLSRLGELNVSEPLVLNKIGMKNLSKIKKAETASDLAFEAVSNLLDVSGINLADIQCLVVVTQNPDGYGLPHTSAILHQRLELPDNTACFDISLGCSGYVYALSIIKSFMESNNFTKGLLVTADPYSKIIDEKDKNTSLIFGDGAAATLISDEYEWSIGQFDMGTIGAMNNALKTVENRTLSMNGRAVFEASAKYVPASINRALKLNNIEMDDVDKIILHQGSKFIVDTIGQRLNATSKTGFFAESYGNTVSSSIPIILADQVLANDKTLVLSGFGVGFSYASTVISKKEA